MPPHTSGFDDVYVLSIPSFTWTKMYPLDREGTGDYPHHSLSCNVVSGAQMLIVGGTFPLSTDCDAADQWGVHNLDMGKQNDKQALWELYSTNKTSYVVPPEIISVVGGSPKGGATKTAPAAGFGHADLKVLMTRKATVATRLPTRAVTPGTSSGPSLSTGALAGIAVGGAVVLIAVAVAGFCLFRRHRRINYHPPPHPGHYHDSQSGTHQLSSTAWSPHSSHFTPQSPYPSHSPYLIPPPSAPPVELPVGAHQFPHGYYQEVPGSAGLSPEHPKQDMIYHQRRGSQSPLHDNIQPVPPVAGYTFQQYNSAAATPHTPQELDPGPRTPEDRPEPRHQTYYHP